MLLSSNKALSICIVFSTKKEKQLAITAMALEIITCLRGSVVQMPVFMVLSGSPRLALCHQERLHESTQVKQKAVRAAMSDLSIVSSFFIPSLWICRGHETEILVYSVAFCA